MSATVALAQNYNVKGVVAGADGDPVVGASVIVSGTTIGVVTDFEGNFTISVPRSANSLEVACMGYVSQNVAITSSNLSIVLQLDAEALEEVIVTAQGLTRKQKSVGYAQTQLDSEQLTTARQTDLGNALAGKIAGARFYGSSGATFDDGAIVLRGTNSYLSETGSEPIYVVDGTITNKAAVNMDDVANISVLKGAAATSLYGSNGANGAVIITTKKAENGKGVVEFSHTFMVETFYNHFNMQNQYGGGSLGLYGMLADAETAAAYDVMSPDYIYGTYAGYVNADGSYYYDYYSDESWGARFDKNVNMASALYYDSTSSKYGVADDYVAQLKLSDLFRTGFTNTTNVSFSKSGQGYNIRASFSNVERTGIQYNSDATRRFASIKADFSPKDWVNISVDWKYTYRQNHNAATEGYSATGNVLYSYLQWGQTNVNLKDYMDYQRPDGSWRAWNITDIDDSTAAYHDNPYGNLYNRNLYSTNAWNVITGDIQFNLPLNIKAGFRTMANLKTNLSETSYGAGSVDYTQQYAQSQYRTQDLTFQGRLTYSDRFINNRLTVDAAAFIEQEMYDYRYLYASTSSGLEIDNFFSLSNSSSYVSASNSMTQYILRSVYANATFGFDDTYFLDANVRNDWDSRLPKANNSYLYGGLSASVMLNNLLPKTSWLNYWKVRASLAQVGSTLSAYAVSDYYYTGTSYNTLMTMYMNYTQVNKNLKPTISTSYEIGTEFRLLGSRLNGDINYYTRDTKNQILYNIVTPQSGYYYNQMNAGLINNHGIEIALSGTPVKTKDFQWDIDFNIAKNINVLKYLDGETETYLLSGNSFYYYWYLRSNVGSAIGDISTMARWKTDEETGKYILTPTTSSAWGGGYRYTLETGEKTVGNFQPDFTGGFGTSLKFRNWRANLSFDYMIGGQMVSWTNMWSTGSGTNASTTVLNNNGVCVRENINNGGGVYVEGIDATTGEEVSCYMNAYYYYHYLAYYDLDYWVYDRTYVKLREVSLTYNVPSKWLKSNLPFVGSASLSFVANNPWLIYSACPNIDPSESNDSFIEGGQAASTRSFGFTLKLSF